MHKKKQADTIPWDLEILSDRVLGKKVLSINSHIRSMISDGSHSSQAKRMINDVVKRKKQHFVPEIKTELLWFKFF